MSDLKIALPGSDYITELKTTQTSIAYSSNNFTVAFANGVATVTTATAHGLTFSPAAGTLPNYFFTFSGVTGSTGTGTLNGPIFQISTIPSTTTFTFATSVTGGTFTSATIQLIFMPVFQSALLSSVANYNPNLSTSVGVPFFGSAQCVNFNLAGNLNAYYNPDNTNIVQGPSGAGVTTISTAPVNRVMAAGTATPTYGQLRFGPQDFLATTTTAGTSYISIVE